MSAEYIAHVKQNATSREWETHLLEDHLKGETAINAKLKRILEELRQGLIALYGEQLAKLILFGSQARGDAQEDSDIDVMVILKGNVHHGREVERAGDLTAGLSLENDVVISCVYMQEKRFLNENSPLLLNVRKEGFAL